MKALDILKDAYELSIGLSYPGYILTPNENSDGLRLLNQMTSAFRFDEYLPDDLTFADTTTEYTYPSDLEEFLVYKLAVRMSQRAGYPISRDVQNTHDDIERKVSAVYAPIEKLETDEALRIISPSNSNTGSV